MDFHFLELSLSESPNFLDYKNLGLVKHVHKLYRSELRRMLEHLIYNHANVKESYQDCAHNHVEKDNVGKLIPKKKKKRGFIQADSQ